LIAHRRNSIKEPLERSDIEEIFECAFRRLILFEGQLSSARENEGLAGVKQDGTQICGESGRGRKRSPQDESDENDFRA
jgi:hypothetical protein